MQTASQPGYIKFALANRRILAFGFLMALGSSFGQTFFIGIFSPSIEAEFGLSHSEWGTIYMAGTLLSAATLTYTGRCRMGMDGGSVGARFGRRTPRWRITVWSLR